MTVSFLYQEGKSALLRAAETGNISAVKRELSGHTDVNSQDEVCHYMCLLNRNILFHLIVQDGATALLYAAMEGHSEIVRYLAEAKPDVDLPYEVGY